MWDKNQHHAPETYMDSIQCSWKKHMGKTFKMIIILNNYKFPSMVGFKEDFASSIATHIAHTEHAIGFCIMPLLSLYLQYPAF